MANTLVPPRCDRGGVVTTIVPGGRGLSQDQARRTVVRIGKVQTPITNFDKAYYHAYSQDMNVSMTPELEALVRRKVESGRYLSASEVMREALRLLEERDKLEELRREELRNAIRKGLDSGPAEPLDMEAVKAEARNRLSPPVKLIRVFL
jgi:antitoxin ParD1/3/4